MKNRDYLVDCLRGYACLLVVLGHVMVGIRNAGLETGYFFDYLEKFIYTFHVALFMFLSGYVYKITGMWERKGTRGKFLCHKLINLGIPYIIFSSIYIVINSVISGTNHNNSFSDILNIWKRPVAQYWFIYALLILFIIWILLSYIFNDVVILFILTIIYLMVSFLKIDVPIIGAALSFAFIFGLGVCIPKLCIDKIEVWKKILFIIFHIFIISVLIVYNLQKVSILLMLAQVIGAFGSVAFISLIYRGNCIEKALLFINKYSFPIYLLHTIFTSAVRIALFKIGFNLYLIHLFAGCIVGVMAPIIIAMFAEKIDIMEFALYPSKVINKYKKRVK